MLGKEIKKCVYVIYMAGKKTILIMLGTVCTARVVEKSPVMHYSLVMML